MIESPVEAPHASLRTPLDIAKEAWRVYMQIGERQQRGMETLLQTTMPRIPILRRAFQEQQPNVTLAAEQEGEGVYRG